jgi:excisionase family DNA binding protein
MSRDSDAVAPVVLTVPEACAVLRISRWTLYELIRSRQLETVKIGSRRVVPMSAVHALLDRLRGGETA